MRRDPRRGTPPSQRRPRRRGSCGRACAAAVLLLLLPSCTLERVGQQQLLNPGSEATYRDWHYSQAVRVDDLVIVSGQVAQGLDIETQPRGAFEKLFKVLAAGGATMEDVVELTTFHTDMTDLHRFAKVKDEFFPRNYPAWTAVGVTALVSPQAKVEVRAVAVRRSGRGQPLSNTARFRDEGIVAFSLLG